MDHVISQVGPNFLDLKFRPHNRIPCTEISLNAKFRLFITGAVSSPKICRRDDSIVFEVIKKRLVLLCP